MGESEFRVFLLHHLGHTSEVMFLKEYVSGDFPGGAVVKNPPANSGDTGSIPGLGRSHVLQSD